MIETKTPAAAGDKGARPRFSGGASSGAAGRGAPSAAGAGAARGRRPFAPRRKVCRFCADKVEFVDFKQVQILRSFTTDRGKILSSRITGNCASHQRQLTRAIKRCRYLSLLPFTGS